MTLKSREPKDAHHSCRLALCAAVAPFQKELSAQELLAVAAQFVGQLLAFQDHRLMSPEMGIQLVLRNIEAGNQAAIESVNETVGNA